jgi:hypothetical protein
MRPDRLARRVKIFQHSSVGFVESCRLQTLPDRNAEHVSEASWFYPYIFVLKNFHEMFGLILAVDVPRPQVLRALIQEVLVGHAGNEVPHDLGR